MEGAGQFEDTVDVLVAGLCRDGGEGFDYLVGGVQSFLASTCTNGRLHLGQNFSRWSRAS